MRDETRVTVDLTVDVDEAELSMATADLEDAVTELVGPGVSGELRLDVRRTGAPAPTPAEREGRPEDPTNVVETQGDGEGPPSASQSDEQLSDVAPSDRPHAGSKARFEVYEDRAGQFRWRLVHHNGNVIADSGEGYSTWGDAENGLRSVKLNAPDAPVERL